MLYVAIPGRVIISCQTSPVSKVCLMFCSPHVPALSLKFLLFVMLQDLTPLSSLGSTSGRQQPSTPPLSPARSPMSPIHEEGEYSGTGVDGDNQDDKLLLDGLLLSESAATMTTAIGVESTGGSATVGNENVQAVSTAASGAATPAASTRAGGIGVSAGHDGNAQRLELGKDGAEVSSTTFEDDLTMAALDPALDPMDIDVLLLSAGSISMSSESNATGTTAAGMDLSGQPMPPSPRALEEGTGAPPATLHHPSSAIGTSSASTHDTAGEQPAPASVNGGSGETTGSRGNSGSNAGTKRSYSSRSTSGSRFTRGRSADGGTLSVSVAGGEGALASRARSGSVGGIEEGAGETGREGAGVVSKTPSVAGTVAAGVMGALCFAGVVINNGNSVSVCVLQSSRFYFFFIFSSSL